MTHCLCNEEFTQCGPARVSSFGETPDQMAKHASDYPGIFRRSPVVYSRYNIASAYSGYRFQPFIKCAKMRKLCNLPRSEHASDIARMYDFRKAKTRFPIDSSAERRVGYACVSTCISRWSPYHYNQ